MQDIYTMVLDRDTIRFVLDTGHPQNYKGTDKQAGVWEPYAEPDSFLFAVLRGEVVGDDASSEEPFTDAWGSFMVGWAPILDAEQLIEHQQALLMATSHRQNDTVGRAVSIARAPAKRRLTFAGSARLFPARSARRTACKSGCGHLRRPAMPKVTFSPT